MTSGFSTPCEGDDALDRNPFVFIVDDESSMRDALSLTLETMGFSSKCFSSAIDFLEFIEQSDTCNPVCLIADTRMPRMSGVELLVQLEKMGKQFPVIMISGHGTTTLKHRVKELGAIAFLEKPFRPPELQVIISTLIEGNRG